MANGDNDLLGGIPTSADGSDLLSGPGTNQLAFGVNGQRPAAAAAPVRPHIDMALGDSIAVQQYKHGVGGMGTPKQYNARNPDPIDWNSNKYTGEVGAPPTRILARIQDMLKNDPDAVRGKNIELMIGSNNPDKPGEFDAIPTVLKVLSDAGVGHVMVPALGPGVQGSGALNVQLGDMVHNAGDNFTFFTPNIRWMKDGVHPANAPDMMNEATKALMQTAPVDEAPTPTPTSTSPLQPQPSPSLQVQPAVAGAPTRKYGAVIPYDATRFTQATGIPQDQYDLYRSYLASRESGSYAQPPNGNEKSPVILAGQTGPGFMGRYQMGSNEITESAKALNMPVPSQQEFLSNPQLQEQLFEQYTLNHNNQLMNTPEYANADPRTRLSLLMGAHLGGVGGVQSYLAGGTGPQDTNQTTVANYVNSAYGVLGGQGSPQFIPPVVGAGYAAGLPGALPTSADDPSLALLGPDPNVNYASLTNPLALPVGATRQPGQQPQVAQQQQPGQWKPNLPPVDLSDLGTGNLLDDPKYRQAMMLQILGAQMRGIQFHPVDYDPRVANKPSPYQYPFQTGLGTSVTPTSEVEARYGFNLSPMAPSSTLRRSEG